MILRCCKNNSIPAQISPFPRKITAIVSILQQLPKVLSVFMQANNSILFYGCLFIFHFVLEPSREKQKFLLQPQHQMWRTIRVCEVDDFSFQWNSMARIAGHYPKKIHPPPKDGSPGFFPSFCWRCQDSGIFNSLVFFTCSIWYFPKELKFLRRCSKPHF